MNEVNTMKEIRPEQLPLARTEQLIIKEVDDEVLVYDLKTDQAHCLNKTAALVWQNCDGSKSIKDIARLLESDGRTNLDDQVVWLALDELDKFNLLLQAGDKPAGISRRQIMRKMEQPVSRFRLSSRLPPQVQSKRRPV